MRYILFLALVFVFFIPSVQAQEVQLGITPLTYSLIAKPGTSIALPFTLTNYADATLVTHRIMRIENTDSLGNYTLLPITDTTVAPQFTFEEFSEEPFLLLAKEKFTSLATLSIPSETKEGDYYYAIVLQTQYSQGFETNSSVKMTGGIALPVFITVSKTGNVKYNISKPEINIHHTFKLPFFSQDILFLDSRYPISGEITIENRGNVIVKIAPNGLLDNKKISLPESIVLAHSRKNFKVTFPETPFYGKHFLKISTGNTRATEDTKIEFITFPFTYFFIVLSLFLTLIFTVATYKRYTNT